MLEAEQGKGPDGRCTQCERPLDGHYNGSGSGHETTAARDCGLKLHGR